MGRLETTSDIIYPQGNGDLDAEGYITVYHKGNLDRPNKPFLSTGTDRSNVEALAREGEVHEFRVPKIAVRSWASQGLVTYAKDLDIATGIRNEEIRFHSHTAKTVISQYRVKK